MIFQEDGCPLMREVGDERTLLDLAGVFEEGGSRCRAFRVLALEAVVSI